MLNRYFRYRSKNEHEIGTPLGHEVDPKGVLARLAGGNLIHMEENEVKYYRAESMVQREGKSPYTHKMD